MDDWDKLNVASLSEKGFYSHGNIGDIAHADYKHGKGVFKGFKIIIIGEYYHIASW